VPLSVFQGIIVVGIKIDLREYPIINFGEISTKSHYIRKKNIILKLCWLNNKKELIEIYRPQIPPGGAMAHPGPPLNTGLRVLELCEAHDIKFICLPPNTTHISQPLDIAFSRLMKGAWRDILREWKKQKMGLVLQLSPKIYFLDS